MPCRASRRYAGVTGSRRSGELPGLFPFELDRLENSQLEGGHSRPNLSPRPFFRWQNEKDRLPTETDLPSPIPRGGPPAVKPQWWQPCVPARSQWEKLCAATTSQRRSFCPGCLPSRRTALPVCVPRAFSNIACRGDGEAPDHDADAIVFDRGPADVVPDVPPI